MLNDLRFLFFLKCGNHIIISLKDLKKKTAGDISVSIYNLT